MPPLDKETATLLRQLDKRAKDDVETTRLLITSLEQGVLGMNGFIKVLQKAGRAHKQLIQKLERDMAAKEALIAKIPKSVVGRTRRATRPNR